MTVEELIEKLSKYDYDVSKFVQTRNKRQI